MQDGAIGIFDSGVGGLTVYRRVAETLPHEPIIYLGDTARVPYGTKSADTVERYARACARVLLERGIKMLIVACNTASAFALGPLQTELPVPVVGVIEPGAQRAVKQSRTGHIGVIGTSGTIQSGQYEKTIRALSNTCRVWSKACPLFVPLAEEGWTDGPVPLQIAKSYLSEFKILDIDTLVLGCTHYPLLKGVIGQAVGPSVTLVDSAEATAEAVAGVLASIGPAEPRSVPPRHAFLVTDAPESFARVGRHFLGREIDFVEWVDI